MKKRILISVMLSVGLGSVSAQIGMPKDTLVLQRTPTDTLTLKRTPSDTLTLQRTTPIYNTTEPIYVPIDAPIYTPVPITAGTELVKVVEPKKIKKPYKSTASVSKKKKVYHKKHPHRAHHEPSMSAVHRKHNTHAKPRCPETQGATNFNASRLKKRCKKRGMRFQTS